MTTPESTPSIVSADETDWNEIESLLNKARICLEEIDRFALRGEWRDRVDALYQLVFDAEGDAGWEASSA